MLKLLQNAVMFSGASVPVFRFRASDVFGIVNRKKHGGKIPASCSQNFGTGVPDVFGSFSASMLPDEKRHKKARQKYGGQKFGVAVMCSGSFRRGRLFSVPDDLGAVGCSWSVKITQ